MHNNLVLWNKGGPSLDTFIKETYFFFFFFFFFYFLKYDLHVYVCVRLYNVLALW